MNNINDKIAVWFVNAMGTMYCVYVFFVLVMIPLFIPTLMTPIMFISSSVIQLIALPLIMVGQAVQGQKTEKRAQEDHESILLELKEIKDIHLVILDLHENKTGCAYKITQ